MLERAGRSGAAGSRYSMSAVSIPGFKDYCQRPVERPGDRC